MISCQALRRSLRGVDYILLQVRDFGGLGNSRKHGLGSGLECVGHDGEREEGNWERRDEDAPLYDCRTSRSREWDDSERAKMST